MANHRLYNDFVARLGEAVSASDNDFINILLRYAEDEVLNFIGRVALPERLENMVVNRSVIAYNKRGAEGESSRTEGGISRLFVDFSPSEIAQLGNYPRKVGTVYARDNDTNNGD